MNSKTLSAGDFIDARCTRCRTLTNHTIVAMVGDKVVRVQCNTCQGIHNFHAPKAAAKTAETSTKRSAAASPRKPRQSARNAELEEWRSLSSETDPDKARPYDMAASYRVGDVINHSVFGYGFIQAVTGSNKVEVLFEEGKKVLRSKQ